MKLEHAARQALEVLRLAKNSHGIMLMSDPPKDAWRFHDVDLKLVEAITALQEALAEPDMNLNCKSVQARLATSWGYVKAEQAEQEPVAWMEDSIEFYASDRPSSTFTIPLYTNPVRTKDLTDKELQPFLDEWWNLPCDTAHDVKNIFRAVIKADREKNK